MSEPGHTTLPGFPGDPLNELRREMAPTPSYIVVDHAGATTEGLVRPRNEDALSIVDDRLFAVADGVGGQRRGDLAAAAAVTWFHDRPNLMLNVGPSRLHAAIIEANNAVLALTSDIDQEPSCTTLVVVATTPTHAVVGWVGDSRVYRRRDGELHCLTRDHSVANELVDRSIPLALAAERGIRLDLLTSYLGRPDPNVAVAAHGLADGDRYLLCTDGVHGQVSAGTISSLMETGTCAEQAEALLAASIEAGGRDNATAIVMEVAALSRPPAVAFAATTRQGESDVR